MPELEHALDELYGADPGDFTATRQRLAKELKEDGDPEASALVAGARKPTAAAWAVNQLARHKRKEIDLLLDAGHRLRQAQAAALRGEGQDAFRTARKAEQSALAALVKEARSLLTKQGSVTQSTLDQVTETLRAAAVSEEGRQVLAVGRFVKALTGGSGFDAVAALAPVRRPADSGAREAKAALRTAEQRRRRLEREADAAEERVQQLQAELADAIDRAGDLRARAKAAGEAARKLGR